jgi:hypothetical protein
MKSPLAKAALTVGGMKCRNGAAIAKSFDIGQLAGFVVRHRSAWLSLDAQVARPVCDGIEISLLPENDNAALL